MDHLLDVDVLRQVVERLGEPGVAGGIGVIDRVAAGVAVEIRVAAVKRLWVFADEAARVGVVPAGPVVIQPGRPVPLPARVGVVGIERWVPLLTR